MNINLDSTNIVITGHKIVAIFFLRRFFISWHTRSHIYAHINIFRLSGVGDRIF